MSSFLFLALAGALLLVVLVLVLYFRWYVQGAIFLAVVVVLGGGLGFLHLHNQLQVQEKTLTALQRQLSDHRQNAASIQGLNNVKTALEAQISGLEEGQKQIHDRIRQAEVRLEERLVPLENRVFLSHYENLVFRKVERLDPDHIAKLKIAFPPGWKAILDVNGKEAVVSVQEQTRFLDVTGKDLPPEQRAKVMQEGLSAKVTLDNRGAIQVVRVLQLMK